MVFLQVLHRRKIILASLLGTFLVCVLGIIALSPKAYAGYVEQNLIEDGKFLDAASMSQADIQSFLQARGGRLATYTAWSDRDNATVPASRIIYEAAQDYGISPKVLLATMQKEQSLVTAKNPTQTQLDRAMGYGCPDSAACNSNYKGFYKQLDNASWQLRYNFERARGNNTWWRNSSSYACGGSTHYYSTGLYVGRNVTFYDDHGHSYKTFTINNASTASLYCYTPHAYPGSGDQYYSGSYNFVTKYEEWFGSTQPDVIITTPLKMSTLREGAYTGQRLTFSFDIKNTAPWPMGVGSMMIAVRDSQNRNLDFGLKQMVIPAKTTQTYTASIVINTEETYTFSIANNYGGTWRDDYPSSISIDNPRKITKFVQAMPTITTGPAISGAEQRIGKSANVSFQVKNNSAQSLNLGKIGLAVRDPNGANRDVGYDTVTSLAANATYSYSKTFMPKVTGIHRATVSVTKDGGKTWDDGSYPAVASGISRSLSYGVLPNPAVVTGISISTPQPHINQPTTLSFQIRNFGDSAISLGKIGLGVRDPDGVNRDPRWDNVTIAAGQTYTYSVSMLFNKSGKWNISIGNHTADRGWNAVYPVSESNGIARKLDVSVLPSVTLTGGVNLATTETRAGKDVQATFTLHNYSNASIKLDAVGLAARGPKGENLDIGWARDVTIAAGQDYTYSRQANFKIAGPVHVTLGGYSSATGWNSGPTSETTSIKRATNITVLPNPTITGGIVLTDDTPQLSQSVTLSFQVRNYGDTDVNLGKIGLAVRDPDGVNRDPRWDNVTIAAGQTYTYSVAVAFNKTGSWKLEVGNYSVSNGWNAVYPVSESGSTVRTKNVVVTP